MTDLADHLQQIRIMDTHEHMHKESEWVNAGPKDVLEDLFSNYIPADLAVAGASAEALKRLADGSDPDVEGRWAGIEPAFQAVRHTGYGEAVRLLAKSIYGMDEITPDALRAAAPTLAGLRRPGERRRLLGDVALLDHIQTDDFCIECLPDASDPEFFLYDLGWAPFCGGRIDAGELHEKTGVTVTSLATLREAFEAAFHAHGRRAVAVKSQHAYARTLQWTHRSDAEAEAVLARSLAGRELEEDERLLLGDWCWEEGARLAGEYDLPFKIHTGYYAGSGYMDVDFIRPGHLCPLLVKHKNVRWVLMHIGYPYDHEMLAMAKHFPNVWVDLCWAWSINPHASMAFVRSFLHAAPANKLFGFGGDTFWPTSAVAYGAQARHWLTRTLQAEVDAGDFTEREAIDTATRLLRTNQAACFDLQGTRDAIAAGV